MNVKRIFKSGLTKISGQALLYAMVVFIPSSLYLYLMTGQQVVASAWFMLLLFAEIGRLSGVRITKQEATVIFLLSGAMICLPWTNIYWAWYRQSELAVMFGIAEEIPWWVAPGPETGALATRNLFHPAFIVPLALYILAGLIAVFTNFGMGYLLRDMFVEVEDLPFPMQTISAETIVSLTESREDLPSRVVAVAGTFGFGYAFVVYTMPFILQAWTGEYMQIIPVPWIDLTSRVEKIFPGAILGIATTLGPLMIGLILPLQTLIWMVLGSFSVYFFGNWLLIRYNISYPWWDPGMTAATAWQRSLLFYWAPSLIGFGLAAGIIPLIFSPDVIKKTFSILFKSRSSSLERRTDIPWGGFKLGILAPLIGGLAATSAVFSILVPEFVIQNPWILAVIVVIPFFIGLVGGRSLGETGVMLNLSQTPPINIAYYIADAPTPVWFARSGTQNTGLSVLSWLKIAQLTETSSKSIFKTYLIFWPISVLLGFLFLQNFWSIAPMPSGRYPGVAIYWPIDATWLSLWIRGKASGLFDPMPIVYSFLLGTILCTVAHFLPLPISVISIAAGTVTVTPVAVTWLLGGALSLGLARFLGKEAWDKNKRLIAGGLFMGESIAVTLAVSISLIINSLWVMPW